MAAAGAWRLLRPQPVAVEPARRAPLVQTLVFTGRVATESRIEVGSTVTGRVVEATLREGAFVRRGQLLARLDDAEASAALRQAEAAAQGARSRIASQAVSARPVAEAALAQADATLRAARAELDRTERLVARGFLSAARLDDARRAVQVAGAQLDGARAQADANAPRGPETEQARLRLDEAAAAAALARARLDQTRIVAPADGLLLVRSVEPGQVVQPGRVLFVMSVVAPIQLVAQADEKFLGQLQVGQRASVVADAFAGQPFEAVVRSIAPTIDAQRGAVEVKFGVPQPPAFLRNDMTLSIEVETARLAEALTVPAQALRPALRDAAGASEGDAGGSPPAAVQPSVAGQAGARPGTPAALGVLRDGRVAEVPVRVGIRALDRVEVLTGLPADAAVVLDPTVPAGTRARPVAAGVAARRLPARSGVTVPSAPAGSR